MRHRARSRRIRGCFENSTHNTVIVHYDCRHFLGNKPCRFNRGCEQCPHHAPFGARILIIKLAAMGDVLRTTPLLRGLRKAYPVSHVTWLTEASTMPMLQGIPEIDRLLAYSFESALQLQSEAFDQLYCFDKEPKATGLAMQIRAARKSGFGLGEFGSVIPLNRESEYAFELGINDELKFRLNKRTYPQLVYECSGLPYPQPQEYLVSDLSAEISEAHDRLAGLGVSDEDLRIGLNTGAGNVFATKKWTVAGYAGLADRLVEELGARVLLLGGPSEKGRNAEISARARYPLVDTGTDNPIRTFSGIVGNCDLVVTGDTLAMHIAIGLRIPVLVIVGATCYQEIELYGRGAMVVSDFDCSPCYLGACTREVACMDAIQVGTVFAEAARLVGIFCPGKVRPGRHNSGAHF